MLSKKNIIFDFDGTIADTVPVMRTIAQNIADENNYGRQLTEEDWEWIRDHTLLEIPKKFGIPFYKIPGLLLAGRNKMREMIFSIPLCKGVEDMLHTLKKNGYSCGILSSTNRETIQEFLLQHKLVDLFDFVHSELNLFGKDKALKSLLKQYQLRREETVYVGDEVRDLDACQKIGMDCISVTWGLSSVKALRDKGAKWIVAKPQEIVTLVTREE